MLEESKPLKVALFVGLITINVIILAVLFGVRLPLLRQATASAPAAKSLPGNTLFMPLVVRFDPVGVADNSSWYIEKDGGDILHIVGEVVNHTTGPVSMVQVQAELLAFRSGESLGKLQGEPFQSVIPAGGKACFNLHVPKPKNYGTYQLSVLSYQPAQEAFNGTIWATNAQYDNHNAWYEINGVFNAATAGQAGDVLVIGTLYELGDLVVGCDQTFVNIPDEEASQPGTFSLIMMDRDFSRVNRYEVQASLLQR